MRKKTIKILVLLALIFLPCGAALAAGAQTGDSVYVAKEEIISGNFYAAGDTITIDGTIGGDLIAAGQTINVNGRVEGDIIAFGQTINVNGEVGGNVRIAGNNLNINNSISRNLNAFGVNIIIGSQSKIGWDALTAGNNLEMRGEIDGNLDSHGNQILISGKIGKDADIKLAAGGVNKKLIVANGTIINGDLNYTADSAAQIAGGANIAGKVAQNQPTVKTQNWFKVWAWSKLFAVFSALVVGLALIFIFKKGAPKIAADIKNSPLKIILPGLISFLILPPIALLFAITVIGIPLALIITAGWLIAVYLAKILTAIALGQIITKKITKNNQVKLFWPLVIGVIVSWLLFAIPFVGWILCLIAVWLGLGGIYLYATDQSRNI